MGWLEDKEAAKQIERILFGGFKPQNNQAGALKANNNQPPKKGLKPHEEVAFRQTFSLNPNSQTAST